MVSFAFITIVIIKCPYGICLEPREACRRHEFHPSGHLGGLELKNFIVVVFLGAN
jgi:hypothetical protein